MAVSSPRRDAAPMATNRRTLVFTNVLLVSLLPVVGLGCKTKVAPTSTAAGSPALQSSASASSARAGGLAGRVTWYEDRQPAVGVAVMVFGIDPPSPPRHTNTDQAGRYAI